MPQYELAQLNIATVLAPLESPVMADFVANLDRVNELADNSAGFIWRLQTDDGNATALRPFGDDVLVNMSVWQDIESLRDFVFSPGHVAIMKRRREWFERMPQAYVALWWIPAGHRPSVGEAKDRLERLRADGPSALAFTFRNPFPAPDHVPDEHVEPGWDECPAS